MMPASPDVRSLWIHTGGGEHTVAVLSLGKIRQRYCIDCYVNGRCLKPGIAELPP